MENKIVKWEEEEYLPLSLCIGEFDTFLGSVEEKYVPNTHDIITKDRRFGIPFYVTKVEGEDIFGYYIKGDSDEK